MDYNYHTHTFRCHHAVGTPEQYIKKAIKGGVKYMGFSEHIPLMFPDGEESWYRLHMLDVELYFKELSILREKYKEQIEIKIGFEMEYYPLYFYEMLANARKFGAEYLILGQHYIKQDGTNHDGSHVFYNTDNHDLKEYVKCVLSGMKSGVFTYLAHPDVINFVGDEEVYQAEMKKICELSKEMSIPIEINFWGIKNNRNYPDEHFWKIAGEIGSPVTFGCDAHDAESGFDEKSYEEAKKLVEKYNLNYIGKPKLVSF